MTETDVPNEPSAFENMPRPLAEALVRRGFEALTPVQTAVLEAASTGRDLRIVSRTGSGKTVALGLAVARDVIERGGVAKKERGMARPEILVVAPTRELAAQVGRELTWLFARIPLRVVTVTGGTNLGLDFRALERMPDVLVGTPGRIVDHITRGAVSLDATKELVLDEADAMLDLGFRDELEQIFTRMPEQRATHLVSATFADEVLALANRHQKSPIVVHGSDVGAAHADIEHIAYLVRSDEKPAAVMNLLLAEPDERTLVFVRTRVDATEVAEGLAQNGFRARAISGEMSQRERTATLEAFRSGAIRVLVATDVAARGLDVQGIACVVHYDIPGSAETLTHRSGRTGRAGEKGKSVMLVPPAGRDKAQRMLSHARVKASWRALPSRAEVEAQVESRLVSELRTHTLSDEDRVRYGRIAAQLVEGREATEVVAMLLSESGLLGACKPRDVQILDPDRGPGARKPNELRPPPAPRGPRAQGPGAGPGGGRGDFVPFQVSWGSSDGADPRRLLAIVCRRGNVSREDVGQIRVLGRSSVVEVSRNVAEQFEKAVAVPDARDRHVRFRPYLPEPDRGGPRRR